MQSTNILGKKEYPEAILALADGTVFKGKALVGTGSTTAEIVFNATSSGYQETITDPSNYQKIIAFSYPHIGNTGINPIDSESSKAQVSAVILRDCPSLHSNYRASQSLESYLQEQNVIALIDIDTRRLTRKLSTDGVQAACVLVGTDQAHAIQMAKQYQAQQKNDSIAQVSCRASYTWSEALNNQLQTYQPQQTKYHVVVYDLGLRKSLLRQLAAKRCQITVVPATASVSEILALNPDGVVISGGPGTPDVFSDYLSTVKDLLQEHSMPIFAVASGMQIFALALDLKLEPLDTGYFANNHPVRDINTDRVYISNQNLRYALHSNELTDDLQATHLSLVGPFVQGFEIKNRPHFAIQAIPEANPGPNDLQVIFDKFINLMSK